MVRPCCIIPSLFSHHLPPSALREQSQVGLGRAASGAVSSEPPCCTPQCVSPGGRLIHVGHGRHLLRCELALALLGLGALREQVFEVMEQGLKGGWGAGAGEHERMG